MSDFDQDLETELHRMLDPLRSGPTPSWSVTASSGGNVKKLLGGAGAALGVKLLTGFAVAAGAATIAVAAAEVAITGSARSSGGQHVTHQVASPPRPHEGTAGDSAEKSHSGDGGVAGTGHEKDTSSGDGQGSDSHPNPKPEPASDPEPTDAPVIVRVTLPPQP
jgi:hypothetical protein